MALEDGKVKTTDTIETVGVEPEEPTDVIDGALGEEKDGSAETEETTETVTSPEIDWAKEGLPQFAGKSPKDVADYIQFRDRKYGEQANELGELRKAREEHEKLKTQITGQETTKKEEVSDVELAMFAEEFNRDPYKAIDKFITPRLTESLKKDLVKSLKEEFQTDLAGHAEDLATKQEFKAFTKEHSDWEGHKQVMGQLMTDAYLGDNASYEEAYKLAVLNKDETSLFSETCRLMKKGVSFDEAKEIASLKQNAAANADTKKSHVKGEVKAAAGGLKRSTAKQKTTEPEIKTMDDVKESMITEQ